MAQESRSKLRSIEVITGLIIILIGFSFITAMLSAFNVGSPYSTLQEDLVYLSDHSANQQINTWAWLATAVLTFIAIPFYLMAFHKRLKALHYVNAVLMLGAGAGALMMGWVGLQLNQALMQNVAEGIALADEQVKLGILQYLRDEQTYMDLGGICASLFAIGLSFTKFRLKRFPFISTVLLMVCGPALIFFNWYDPDHVLRTAAMAGLIIGMIIFCIRLINKGL